MLMPATVMPRRSWWPWQPGGGWQHDVGKGNIEVGVNLADTGRRNGVWRSVRGTSSCDVMVA